DQYRLQAERFSAAVRSGSSLPIELEWSLGTMKVLNAIQRSAESGNWETV
ncbi:MAG: gfo/Idh/MocA family oxidoreductase, partial [Mesorhizobium sp.]